MEESKTVILENNEEYNVIDVLIYNNFEYYLLSNVNNIKDICIRKIVKEDRMYVSRLESDELRTVYAMFLDKNKDIINE